jgi:transcriptional/translational regulatory protein YebC/TACO1
MFDQRGVISVDAEGVDEEQLMELALEAGAEDVLDEEDSFQIYTAPEDFNSVVEQLEQNSIKMSEAGISMVPKNTIAVEEEKTASNLLRLLESLEDHDDVQKVHANFDLSEELMEKLS